MLSIKRDLPLVPDIPVCPKCGKPLLMGIRDCDNMIHYACPEWSYGCGYRHIPGVPDDASNS